MSRYTVVITREGDQWLADVPELEGVHTWALNLPQLFARITEAIMLALDEQKESPADSHPA